MTEPDFHTPDPTPGAGLRPPRSPAPAEYVSAKAEDEPESAPPEPPAGRGPRSRLNPRLLALLLVAVAALIGVGVWLAFKGGGSSSPSPVPQSSSSRPVLISVKGLRTIAGFGIPIYWAGEKPGMTYELTKTNDNRVFIRYLPAGVQIGTSAPYLTIATYPMQGAFKITSGLATKSGSVKVNVGNGGVAFYNQKTPTNVYVAYPSSNAQIEVYDPSAAEAQRIAASGEVTRVR